MHEYGYEYLVERPTVPYCRSYFLTQMIEEMGFAYFFPTTLAKTGPEPTIVRYGIVCIVSLIVGSGVELS